MGRTADTGIPLGEGEIMSQSIKGLFESGKIKPPFIHMGCGFIGCSNHHLLDVPGHGDKNQLANVRGWGFFGYLEDGERLQDEWRDFVVAALNEKYERDFGERKPKCTFCCEPVPHRSYSFCPNCGQKLEPPEGE